MMAKLLFVVCIQAVLLKAISAQAYGIISPNCGCSNAIPSISVSNCGCSASVPISVPNCGCSNAVNNIAVQSCGYSNGVNAIELQNGGYSNGVNTIEAQNCGYSNAGNNIAVSSCGYSNGGNTISAPSCGCSNGINTIGSSGSSSNFGFSRTTTASTGGPLTVTCYGPLSSNGVQVLADLGIHGDVEVTGTLPFLSAVVLEGNLPTSGVASVNYGCGDGNIVILQETGNPSGRNAASGSGLNLASLGAGACGCRSY